MADAVKKQHKEKVVAGLTVKKRHEALHKPSLQDISDAGTSLGDVALQARGVILVYCSLAGLCAALWALLYETILPPKMGSVWVRICGDTPSNVTNSTVGLEAPIELSMTLLAVYLAEDVNITTMAPIYGASRYTTAKPTPGQALLKPRGGKTRGLISESQNARRVWTHPACDTDGDGIISDCDISARWKYPKVVTSAMSLAPGEGADFNPSKHEVCTGQLVRPCGPHPNPTAA
jgi:hypothetical protein